MEVRGCTWDRLGADACPAVLVRQDAIDPWEIARPAIPARHPTLLSCSELTQHYNPQRREEDCFNILMFGLSHSHSKFTLHALDQSDASTSSEQLARASPKRCRTPSVQRRAKHLAQ